MELIQPIFWHFCVFLICHCCLSLCVNLGTIIVIPLGQIPSWVVAGSGGVHVFNFNTYCDIAFQKVLSFFKIPVWGLVSNIGECQVPPHPPPPPRSLANTICFLVYYINFFRKPDSKNKIKIRVRNGELDYIIGC